MELNTFHDLGSLVEHANERLDEFDTISLDIFETIFIRRIPNPDMIKPSVSRFIAEQAERLGIHVSARTVSETRNRIEREHRIRNGLDYPDHEACYDDFMQEALAEIFGVRLPKDLFGQVAEFEMRMECAMIVTRSVLFEWIKSLHGQGKRVFLISDIYLPARYLKQIARDKGVLDYVEDVISSADSFNAKASGTAFPLIAERYGLDKERWLHIGDNPISDNHRPNEHGITSMHIRDISEHHRLSLATQYNFFASQRDFWRGRNLYQWMLPLEAENRDRDPLYADGFGFMGFLLSFFIHRLIERCKEEAIERVYFCSREGWMFQRIWDEMAPWFYPAGDAPRASYLYVSRMGLASPACAFKGLTPVSAQVARFPAGNRDFHDMCRIFKLDVDALEPHLKRYGITANSAIGMNAADYDKQAAIAFGQLLQDKDFQADVKAQCKTNNDALQLYLEEQDFFNHDKVAFVDIGWLGTIQHYLTDALDQRTDTPRVFGFTFGAIRAVSYEKDCRSSVEGLVHDLHWSSFFTSMTNMIKPILEEVCRAPHPTLLGYEIEDGKSKLVFRRTDDDVGQAEISQDAYFRPLHEGIVDAARRYAPAAQINGYSTAQLRPWLNYMYLMRVAFPKTKEVSRLRHKEHQDDFFGRNKPSRKALRMDDTLWTASDNALRFNPFLRTWWLLKNALLTVQR
jgi:predicted HAD superfamily hydrolase